MASITRNRPLTWLRWDTVPRAVLAAALVVLPAGGSFSQEKKKKPEAELRPVPPKDPAKVEAHRRAAEAVVDAVNTKDGFAQTLRKMLEGQLKQFADAGAPPEGVDELRAVTVVFLEEIYVWEEIKKEFIDAYMDAFTKAELTAIAEFYGSPVGKKAMITMPRVASRSAQIGQNRLVENQSEFSARVRPIFEKYLGETAGGDGVLEAKKEENETGGSVDGEDAEGKPEPGGLESVDPPGADADPDLRPGRPDEK